MLALCTGDVAGALRFGENPVKPTENEAGREERYLL
jgi:hypothetical protein